MASGARSRPLSLRAFDALVLGLRKLERWRYRALARDATLRTRPYQADDEREIRRLFYATFRKRKSSRRWRWQYLENPYRREANVVLLESDGVGIVGHYGGIPLRFHCQGGIIPVAQSADVMIHLAFRGKAALEHLVHAYIRHSRDSGMKLLYGFNGAVVARSNRRFFRAALARVSEWACEIPPSARRASPGGALSVLSPARFDERADALWGRIQGDHACAAIRDRSYLDWRYSPRSDREYALCEIADPSPGGITAMAVLGVSERDGLILELLSDPDDADSIAALLQASLAHFARAGTRRVRVWLPPHGKLRECARAAGFRSVDSGLYLNLLSLDDSLDAAALTESFYYTLGDYDVY